jgi:hypothetical protein
MRTFRCSCSAVAILGSLFAATGQAADGIAAAPTSWQGENFPDVSSSAARTWKVIYTTFNHHRDHLYSPKTAWGFEGAKAGQGGTRYSVAMPFSPAEDGIVHRIVLAIGVYDGIDDRMSMTLREDAGGLPGAVIERFQLVDVPDAWQCCQTVPVRMKGVPVTAGKQYWVALSARGDTSGIWYVNSIGLHGPMAMAADDEWRPVNDKLSAFSVLGE